MIEMTEGKVKIELESLYRDLAGQMLLDEKLKCIVYGSAGIICEPCPRHKDDPYDGIFIDYNDTLRNRWFCIKDFPSESSVIDELPSLSQNGIPYSEETLSEIKLQSKIKPREQETFRSVVVEKHYLTNNIILSISTGKKGDQESYVAYIYDQQDGIYKVLGPGAIKTDLQPIYEKFFTVNPPISLEPQMKNKIYKLTARGDSEAIFLWDKGSIYYLPGRVRDIEINKVTGEVKLLEKDPVNRPFIKRMNYDFSADPPVTMPPEVNFLKKYTTPRFFVNILTLVAKAIVLQGLDKIFINYSRVHGAGKSSLFSIIGDLFGDVVTKATVKDFYYQFFEATLVEKTILLMEEYKGYSEKVNNDLKDLASVNGTLEGEVKFQTQKVKTKSTLTVALNMNALKLHESSLKDEAFMQRLVVTPFTHIWSKEEYPQWDEKQKEKVVLWIVKNLVPAYLTGKLKPETYKMGLLKEWIERYDGIPPEGIDIFLKNNAYKEENPKNTNGVFTPLTTAYRYYQMWCDSNDYLPVTDVEFEDLMHYAINAEYLFEKDFQLY